MDKTFRFLMENKTSFFVQLFMISTLGGFPNGSYEVNIDSLYETGSIVISACGYDGQCRSVTLGNGVNMSPAKQNNGGAVHFYKLSDVGDGSTISFQESGQVLFGLKEKYFGG